MRRLLVLTTLVTAALAAPPAGAQDEVLICHSTGSAENPYVPLSLDNAGVLEHVDHEDDLVPAPAGGCPTTAVVLPDDTPTPTPTPTPTHSVPSVTATPTPTPRPDRRPRNRRRDREDDDEGSVKGGGAGGRTPSLTSTPPASGQVRGLPMTGAELWLIAGAGIGFMLAGVGLRFLTPASGRPPGPSGR